MWLLTAQVHYRRVLIEDGFEHRGSFYPSHVILKLDFMENQAGKEEG
jgi:hypothetical protein